MPFPYDVVPEIVRFLRDDIATLRSANQVCHEWHHWVSPIVMRTVAVVRGPALAAFVYWARSADRIVGTRDPLDHIWQFKLLKGEPPNELTRDWLILDLARFVKAMTLLRAVRLIRMETEDVCDIQQLCSPLTHLPLQHWHPSPWQIILDAHLERQNTIQSLLPLQQAFLVPLQVALFEEPSVEPELRRQLNQLVPEWPRKHLIKAIEVDAQSMLDDRVLDGYDNLAILSILKMSGLSAANGQDPFSLIPAKHLIALRFHEISWILLREACFTNLQFDNLRFISLSIDALSGDDSPSQSMDATLRRLLNRASNLDTVRVNIKASFHLVLGFDSLYDVLIEECPRLVAIQIGSDYSPQRIRYTPMRASLDAITHLHISVPITLRYILDECTADWFARLRTLVVEQEAMTYYDSENYGHDSENYGDSIQVIGAIVNMLRDIEFLRLPIQVWTFRDIDPGGFFHDLVDTLCSGCQRLSRLDLGFWRWEAIVNDVDLRPHFRELLEGCRSLKRVFWPSHARLDPDDAAVAQSRGIAFVDDLGEGVFSVFRDQDRILGLN